MAKKLNLNDYVKKTDVKKSNKWIIFFVLLIFSLIANGVLGYYTYNLYTSKEKIQKSYKSYKKECESDIATETQKWYDVSTAMDNLDNGNSLTYVKEKLKFMNDNIVFVIQGYGKYYYSYDCMRSKVSGSYSYWAYNIDAATGMGYKKGTC